MSIKNKIVLVCPRSSFGFLGEVLGAKLCYFCKGTPGRLVLLMNPVGLIILGIATAKVGGSNIVNKYEFGHYQLCVCTCIIQNKL